MLFGKGTRTMVEEKPLEKPVPQPVTQALTDEEFELYTKTAKAVGYEPDRNTLLHERLKDTLAKLNIPIYDEQQVFDWMTKKAIEASSRSSQKTWVWVPLRQKDVREIREGKRKLLYFRYQLEQWVSELQERVGVVTRDSTYTKIIPASVLQTVARVQESFPEAHFFVSDIKNVPKADPFLAVAVPGQPFLVIDFWDEPGFKPKTD